MRLSISMIGCSKLSSSAIPLPAEPDGQSRQSCPRPFPCQGSGGKEAGGRGAARNAQSAWVTRPSPLQITGQAPGYLRFLLRRLHNAVQPGGEDLTQDPAVGRPGRDPHPDQIVPSKGWPDAAEAVQMSDDRPFDLRRERRRRERFLCAGPLESKVGPTRGIEERRPAQSQPSGLRDRSDRQLAVSPAQREAARGALHLAAP